MAQSGSPLSSAASGPSTLATIIEAGFYWVTDLLGITRPKEGAICDWAGISNVELCSGSITPATKPQIGSSQTNYVQVVNDTSFPMSQTFFQFYRADGSSYGLGHYPKPAYKFVAPFGSVPGEVRVNTGHNCNNVAMTLCLTDAQLQALTLSIFAHSGDNYNLENASLYNRTSNCTGWANIVLSDAGLPSPGSAGGFPQNPWSN